MNAQPKAYNELIDLLLSEEDREKFEWSIGAVLADGPPNVVVVMGPTGTGKSSLLKVIRKTVLSPDNGGITPRVAFLHSMTELTYFHDATYTFVEVNASPGDTVSNVVSIETTGNLVPVNKHYVLMRQIDSELPMIADRCYNIYTSLGENYYHPQEN